MNDWLYLLLIPVLLIAIWFWPEQKSHSAARRSNDETDGDDRNRFHAVSIQPCSHACNAVMNLSDKRFLAGEVMSLPVPGCDASRCQCTYKHYSDRRKGKERRHGSIAMKHVYAKNEHRTGEDRRQQHVFQ